MAQPRLSPINLNDQVAADPVMSLGGHEFYVNPQSYQKTSTNVIFKNVTQGGIFLQTYTPDVIVHKLAGTYSNAGLDEVKATDHVAPEYQQGAIVPYAFTFPPLGLTNRQVYVSTYTVSFEQDDIWYIHYQWELWEVPIAHALAPVSPTAPAQAVARPSRGF